MKHINHERHGRSMKEWAHIHGGGGGQAKRSYRSAATGSFVLVLAVTCHGDGRPTGPWTLPNIFHQDVSFPHEHHFHGSTSTSKWGD